MIRPAHRPATQPPFRADHIGSLLRPKELRDAFRRHQAGDLGNEAFRAVQDDAIRQVVALQEHVGLRSITDGEFRRASYWAHFVDAVDGLAVGQSRFDFRDAGGELMSFTAPVVQAPVRRRTAICGDEFDFLRTVTSRTPKVTLPSPSTMHFWGGTTGVYPTVEDLFADLAAVYRAEIRDLVNRGATYLQIDEVPLAMLCDADVEEATRASGHDPASLIAAYVDALNAAVADRPEGVTVAVHLCRGNYKGRWLATGGYEQIAERVFGGLDVDAFFLEFDTPRAGDFQPLRYVAPGKTVVLGLVSSKTSQLEDPDALLRRIDAACEFVPHERLALSPQCGFASTAGGNPLTEEDERRKLALVVEVAERSWGG